MQQDELFVEQVWDYWNKIKKERNKIKKKI